MRALACIALAAALAPAIPAQPRPKFNSVDIHPSGPNTIPLMRSHFIDGHYVLHNATLIDLIRIAWNVDADNVSGGPEWLDETRFDVIAMAPANSTPENLHMMLQAMLSERFQLAAHQGSKDLPAYAITTGKTARLEQADGSDAAGCSLQPSTGPAPPPPVAFPPVLFVCRNMSMAALAEALPRMQGAGGYLFGYRVVDRTGLNGTWNFNLTLSPRYSGAPRHPATNGITIFDAFDKQLGLKLRLGTAPAPVVIIDSVAPKPVTIETTRSINLPEFEVADLKRESPEVHGTRVGVQRGGEVYISGTLRGLIAEAWGDIVPNRIADAPKFIDGIQWSIMAKTPAQEPPGPGNFDGVDVDTMRMMLRSLLLERFGLRAHNENRRISGYALIASKPKLRKADPANRPRCSEGPGADGKDPRITNPMASRLLTCRNTTLARFVTELNTTDHFAPIVDATEIAGRYDITINFTPPTSLANAVMPFPGSNEEPPEPDGAIPLSDALLRQLGLKLESRKVMAPVLVIDQVSEIPTDN